MRQTHPKRGPVQIRVDQEHAPFAFDLENRKVECDGRFTLALVRGHDANYVSIAGT